MSVQAVANLPWKEIIRSLPALVDAATRIWNKLASQPKAALIKETDEPKVQLLAVSKRLEALESAEVAQAKLVADLLQQLQGLSSGLAEVSRRSNIALALAAISTVASCAAFAVAIKTWL